MELKLSVNAHKAEQQIEDIERHLSESKNKENPDQAYKKTIDVYLKSPIGLHLSIEANNTDDDGNQLIDINPISLWPTSEGGTRLKRYLNQNDSDIIIDMKAAIAMRDFLNFYINNFPEIK